jgi:dTDP-4-dehydrorhamnose reductase
MRILLTGAAGLFGNALLPALSSRYDVLATFRDKPIPTLPGNASVSKLDLTDGKALANLCKHESVDLVINCAGSADVDRCETDHLYASRGNRDIVANLLEAQRTARFRLIHISTDYVFDGQSGPATESAEPNPINFYGESKLSGEELIRAAAGNACIIRVCALYSLDLQAGANFYQMIVSALRVGKSFTAATDLYTNPTEVNDLARCLAQLIGRDDLPPLLHLAAPEFLSRYEFAQQIARREGLDDTLIRPAGSNQFDFAAPRPKLAGLDSRLVRIGLGVDVRSLTELPRN